MLVGCFYFDKYVYIYINYKKLIIIILRIKLTCFYFFWQNFYFFYKNKLYFDKNLFIYFGKSFVLINY